VNTRTAERTFAKAKSSRFYLRAAIHSAVRVFTGEADEIAAQKLRLLRLNHLIFTLLDQALFFGLRFVIVFD